MPATPYYSTILENGYNPQFENRSIFLQPNTNRDRAAYRSPLQSESINLIEGQTVEDIANLFDIYEQLNDKLQEGLFYLASFVSQDSFWDYVDWGDSLQEYVGRLKAVRTAVDKLVAGQL